VTIARVAVPVATNQLFDYWVPAGLHVEPGNVVRVAFGRRRIHGVVTEMVRSSELSPDRILPIQEVVESLPPLPADLRALAQFVAAYYQQPIGQCFAQLVPPLGAKRGGRERRRTDAVAAEETKSRRDGIELNGAQRQAIDAALPQPSGFAVSLLQGVTGSGKTEVYLAAAARVIREDRQALFLVPEIHLTPQLEQRIGAALPGVRVVTLHSALRPAERLGHWLAAASGEAQLVVGTRLAVFAPLPRLGVIAVDEEHDASFRQQDGVRYHARDVAIYRARLRGVPVLLGSATPSLESYAQAQRGRYRWLRLPQRARPQAALPSVRLVPNRDSDSVEGLGRSLRAAIAERLARGEQSLLFINRRGFAPSLLCVACGWKAMCPRCAARLVVHRDAAALRCHHCGHKERIPVACPDCGNRDLFPLGFGTQRLERALEQLFPGARVMRVDRDSTRRSGAFAAMFHAITSGDVDILVGTQMLAKGHDFARLTLVGVLGCDNALYSADFRATERLFALLEQVAGRAGRGALRGEVLVQTDFPEHPLFAALVGHDYDRFAEALLTERRSLGLPPFGHLALLAAEATSRAAVSSFLERAVAHGNALANGHAKRCEVFPPVAAALARRAGMERGQVLVQASERRVLQNFLARWREELERLGPRTVRWSLDVDPVAVG
jgi:primosomal protein N' (replication factor Y)